MVRSIAFSVITKHVHYHSLVSLGGTRPKRLSGTHRTMEGGGGGGAGEAASLVFLLEVFLINQAGQLFELFSPDS
jgi:hypothetical protein